MACPQMCIRDRDKVIKDYIKIEYGDGGNLYLPATRLESIQKYARCV